MLKHTACDCGNCFCLFGSQINGKLRESNKEAQTDASQAITESDLVQPSVSTLLHRRCISIIYLLSSHEHIKCVIKPQ